MIFTPPPRSLWLLLLFFSFSAPLPAWAQQGAREAMADAMARMMEAMGLFESAPMPPGPGAAPAYPMSMMGPLGASGWGSAIGVPWGSAAEDSPYAMALRELQRQFTRQATGPGASGGHWPLPWAPSRLEGVWEGRDGELLIVQGSRFRIYSYDMQRVDGRIEIRDNRLALYNPLDQHAKPFEFAESQGRLVMRDLAGDLYLYRRLRLDGWQTGSAGTPSER